MKNIQKITGKIFLQFNVFLKVQFTSKAILISNVVNFIFMFPREKVNTLRLRILGN